MFVQSGVDREPRQAHLGEEAQGWQAGQFRESFRDPAELREKIPTAIHCFELATTAAPVDPASLIVSATAALR